MAPNFVCMASANQSQYAAYKVIFIIMGAFALCFMLLVMCTRVPELKTSDITKIENVVSEVCYCIESKRLIFGRVEEKAPATLQ